MTLVASSENTCSDLHEPLLDGVLDQLDNSVNIELLHDVGSMDVHGLRADVEHLADLAVGLALGKQREDLPFPGRQRVDAGSRGWRLTILEQAVENLARH